MRWMLSLEPISLRETTLDVIREPALRAVTYADFTGCGLL